MEQATKTTEPLLREYDAARVITSARIARTDEGYVLVVRISWKPGEHIVFNQRGKPRAWVSLDRLLAYLQETLPSVRTYELRLDEELHWDGSSLGKGSKESPKAKTAAAQAATKTPGKKAVKT